MSKKALQNKRERFFATKAEQDLIIWLRNYGWNSIINEAVTKSIYSQLEMAERQKLWLKQEGLENTREFEELVMSQGLLEVLYVRWKELMQEVK